MALEVDQIAAVAVARRVPEVLLSRAEQRADRGEARDVAAELVVVLFARTTSTIAFQRQIERMRSSSAILPGECSSMCGAIVLTYAVFGENGMYAPERRALSISRSRR